MGELGAALMPGPGSKVELPWPEPAAVRRMPLAFLSAPQSGLLEVLPIKKKKKKWHLTLFLEVRSNGQTQAYGLAVIKAVRSCVPTGAAVGSYFGMID